jgi:hypothetical protein
LKPYSVAVTRHSWFPADHEKPIRRAARQREEEQDALEGELAPVDIVAQEKVRRRHPALPKDPDEVLKVAVDVTDDVDWRTDLNNNRLTLKMPPRLIDQCDDVDLRKARNRDLDADGNKRVFVRSHQLLEMTKIEIHDPFVPAHRCSLCSEKVARLMTGRAVGDGAFRALFEYLSGPSRIRN